MKSLFVLIFLAGFFACSPALPQSESKTFDERAKRFFKNNLDRFDLAPMSTSEKCILERTIANDLTALNDWRTVLFYDTFNLKTYSDPYLQLPLSFIENRRSGKFYFLWLPFLRDYLYKINADYRLENDSIYSLQGPIEAIKIPSEPIDIFFDNAGFLVKDESSYYRNVRFAQRLMSEILPLIFVNEIPLGSFEQKIENLLQKKELQEANYSFIKDRLVNPIFTSEFHRLQTFYLENMGYVVLTYAVDSSSQLKVDIYFIPNRKRYWLSRGVSAKYRECFR